MKHKYRILEKHYDDGSVWFMLQIGDWWNGWRYLSKSHPCPDVDSQRIAYRTFEEADAYMRDFIKRDKQNIANSTKRYSIPTTTKIHNYIGDCHD